MIWVKTRMTLARYSREYSRQFDCSLGAGFNNRIYLFIVIFIILKVILSAAAERAGRRKARLLRLARTSILFLAIIPLTVTTADGGIGLDLAIMVNSIALV